jgi:hypothetical protein
MTELPLLMLRAGDMRCMQCRVAIRERAPGVELHGHEPMQHKWGSSSRLH